jgi:hypothetical protein
MLRKLFLAIAALALGPFQLQAQSNISAGEIRGTVTDSTGAVLQAAQISLANQDTSFSRSTMSDPFGQYRFVVVPPGAYSVRFELPGFESRLVRDVQLTVGGTIVLDATLAVARASSEVSVSAEVPLLEPTNSQQSTTIAEPYLRNLPINRRDYLLYTLLSPGISDATTVTDNSDFRVKQTPQSGLSFYGSNGRGNNITVDGGEANDAWGGVRPTLSQEAVQEFQINRSNYSAELGGATGGVINIVSKSGTNEIHGSMFGFFRNEHFDAADPFAIALKDGIPTRVKPSLNREQYGGGLGLPVVRNRTFLFGAFERLDRHEFSSVPVLTDLSIFGPTAAQLTVINGLSTNSDPVPIPCINAGGNLSALAPTACAAALRGALSSKQSTIDLLKTNSGVFPFSSRTTEFSLRLDHRGDDRNQFISRYNFTTAAEDNQSTRALFGFSRSNNTETLDSTILGGWTHVLTPTFINELRLQWNYRRYFVLPNDPYGPELNITGYGFFNRDIFLPSRQFERRYEVSNSLTYVRSHHRLKMGGSVLVKGNKNENHVFFGGRFGFGTLPGSLLSPFL